MSDKEGKLQLPTIEISTANNHFAVISENFSFASGTFKTQEEAIKFIKSQITTFLSEIISKSIISSEPFTAPFTSRSYPNLPNTLALETTQIYAATKKHI